MHPLVRGSAAAAILFALGGPGRSEAPPLPTVVPPAGAGRGTEGLAALCGLRTVPEGSGCVPLSVPKEASVLDKTATRSADNHQQIYRRPDRPADAMAYLYPIESTPRIGRNPITVDQSMAKSPSGIDFVAERGQEVHLVSVEAQQDKAEVVFVGELFGISVTTLHQTQDTSGSRKYLLIHGHLDHPGPGVVQGARLAAGDLVGFAGDSGSPGVVHLHFEVRQVREDVNLSGLDAKRLLDSEVAIPCDPRNVLPLRAGPP